MCASTLPLRYNTHIPPPMMQPSLSCPHSLTSHSPCPFNATSHTLSSSLTFLLRESLGGNSKTTVICACSSAAADAEETMSTLRFAQVFWGGGVLRVKSLMKTRTMIVRWWCKHTHTHMHAHAHAHTHTHTHTHPPTHTHTHTHTNAQLLQRLLERHLQAAHVLVDALTCQWNVT